MLTPQVPALQQSTTAVINGHPVVVHQEHRPRSTERYTLDAPDTSGYEPVVATVTAPIALALDDIAAVLFRGGSTYEELTDDHTVRWLIAEEVLNRGCGWVEELRADLHTQALTVEDLTYLDYCYHRASTVFSPASHHKPGGPTRVLGPVRGVLRRLGARLTTAPLTGHLVSRCTARRRTPDPGVS